MLSYNDELMLPQHLDIINDTADNYTDRVMSKDGMKNILKLSLEMVAPRQKEILTLFVNGMTQTNIAKKLKITDQAVNYSLYGQGGKTGSIGKLRKFWREIGIENAAKEARKMIKGVNK